jgi:hypothetical protein
MRSLADARSLFKADAGFEAVFGSLLLTGVIAGFINTRDVPVAQAVIICAGIAFLLASASQLVYFINAAQRVLLELAVGNSAMAAAGFAWLLLDSRFSAPGAALIAGASAWKLGIGLVQTRALTRASIPR